jgi:hypothetical protein
MVVMSSLFSDEERKLFERLWPAEQAHYQAERPEAFWPAEFEQDQNLFRKYRAWRQVEGPGAKMLDDLYKGHKMLRQAKKAVAVI